jgi:hypothetical protein
MEPNPPILPGKPMKLDMNIENDELKYKDITQTDGYQSWLKLLELVKNKDRKEYSK